MDVLANITETEITEATELPIGFLFASIKNIGNSPALVGGVSLAIGEAKSYPFVGKGYNEIPIDPQDSTLLVMQII